MEKQDIGLIVSMSDIGGGGSLKLSGYHELVTQAHNAFCGQSGQSLSQTLKKGYAWAFVSLSLRVIEPITAADCFLHAGCRLCKAHFPYACRDMSFYSENKLVFEASVKMVPLDLSARGMLMDESIVSGLGKADGTPLFAPQPHLRLPLPAEPCEQYTVLPDDIDALGHMNNCRYAAAVYDRLSSEWRDTLAAPFEYTMIFRGQLALGESMSISRSEQEGRLYLMGKNQAGRTSFICLLEPHVKHPSTHSKA